MDERAQVAFGKIKQDMNTIRADISQLKQAQILTSEIKNQLDYLKSVRLDTFVTNLEKEFVSINSYLQQFQTKFTENGEDFKQFAVFIHKYHTELEDIKKNLLETQTKTKLTEEVLSLVTHHLEEYNKKQDIEHKSDITTLSERLIEIEKRIEKIPTLSIEVMFSDFQRLFEEKIAYERKKLKEEFTTDHIKMYDRFFVEVTQIKEHLKMNQPQLSSPRHDAKGKQEQPKKELLTESEKQELKDGAKETIKKLATWFLDDKKEKEEPKKIIKTKAKVTSKRK